MHIIGHKKIVNFLEKSIEKGVASGAYLFCGAKHLGKFTLAYEFAKKLTGQGNGSISPDIVIIRPETEEKKGIIKERDIKIEQVRELQKELSRTPHFGKMKVAIIDDADRLTTSAQNALLKTLEESNENIVIILVCHNQEKILATIKSRCMVRNFNTVNLEEIARALPEKSMTKEVAFWSLGYPGLALDIANHPEKQEALKESKKNLEKMASCSLVERFSLAEELSKDQRKLTEELKTWIILLRQNIITGGEFLGMNLGKTLEIIERTIESLSLIRETNSNTRLVLENLFLKF